jgi:transposase
MMPFKDFIRQDEGNSFIVDCLGVIAVFFKQFNLINFVDQLLPNDSEDKISHGESFLLLSLLSFTQDRRSIYDIKEYFYKMPLFLFFNRDIDINDLNDDALARFLEAINDYSPSEFFLKVVSYLASFLPNYLNFDRLHTYITNFIVYDQFSDNDIDNYEYIKIVHGHPKDKHNNLECLSLGLVSNSLGIPIYMMPLSDNYSCTNELNLIIDNFLKSIKNIIIDDSKPLFIADPEFYNEKNIYDFPIYFITKVPESINEAKDLIYKDIKLIKCNDDLLYSFYLTTSNYAKVKQNWLLVHSTEMAIKKAETFERQLNKAMENGTNALDNLGKKLFACEEDARREANKWIEKQKYLKFESLEIISKDISINNKKNNPKLDENICKNYLIMGKLCYNSEVIEKERVSHGRFILATNNSELSSLEILNFYKEQSKIWNCFRFIKSNNLRISEILLGKPERIRGLCCFISLVGLISSLLEHMSRSGLKQNGMKINGYGNKRTDNPTLNFSFFKLKNFTASILYNKEKDAIKISFPLNGKNDIIKILESLGQDYLDFYSYKSEYVPIEKTGNILKNLYKNINM